MKKTHIAAAVLALSLLTSGTAFADHGWHSPSGVAYHWARTANPFTLVLGDNLTSSWDPYLATTVADWSASTVLDLTVVPGTKSPKTCKPTLGRGEICNAKYGSNGWLGIAQIWASGEHIAQAVVKMNDTYFSRTQYNTSAWKNLVMCQEVGHIFGLDHQDETMTNANLNTCMDYTNNPASNQHPNQHDYDMLEEMYAHLDSSSSLGTVAASAPAAVVDERGQWGREVRRSDDGRASLFVRDLGNGNKVLTHVFWAEEERGRAEVSRDR